MRQADDPDFQSFLDRVRAACVTQDDITRLNSKVVTSIFDPRFDTATVVVKRNSTRQAINRARLWHFAESRAQRIYLFAAQDSRTVSTSNSRLTLEDLLSQQDDVTKCPCPGLFMYTPGMPVMILANVCTLMGQVNGTMGIATKVEMGACSDGYKQIN
jgi:hypothetical protein